MLKIMLWDIDGVIIRHKDYFSDQLQRDGYYNPVEILNEFRKTGLNESCDKGELDPIKSIKPFLDRIGWEKTCKEYFDAQYEYEDQYIDDNLIEDIQELRVGGVKSFITSNQNYYRMRHLIRRLKLNTKFDGMFFSNEFGSVKTDDVYWVEVIKKMEHHYSCYRKEDMLFLDDMESNIEQARRNGIKGKVISGLEDIEEVIKNIRKHG